MGARASGPLMIMLFRTARVPRAHDLMSARGRARSETKTMSGPEARAPSHGYTIFASGFHLS